MPETTERQAERVSPQSTKGWNILSRQSRQINNEQINSSNCWANQSGKDWDGDKSYNEQSDSKCWAKQRKKNWNGDKSRMSRVTGGVEQHKEWKIETETILQRGASATEIQISFFVEWNSWYFLIFLFRFPSNFLTSRDINPPNYRGIWACSQAVWLKKWPKMTK